MGHIIFSNTDNSVASSINFSEWNIEEPLTSKIIYDKNISNSYVFVKSITFEETDSNIIVCLLTKHNKLECFETSTYDLELKEIQKITLQRKNADFVIPGAQPKNNDETKEDTSLWNHVWFFIIFELIFIISVYTYMTFQKRRALNVYQ